MSLPVTGETILHNGTPCVIRAVLRHGDGSITCKLEPIKKPVRRSWLARLFKK